MAAPVEKKRGLEHLDEYEPKPAKYLRSLHDRMAERRLVVILEGASLETVKVRPQPGVVYVAVSSWFKPCTHFYRVFILNSRLEKASSC